MDALLCLFSAVIISMTVIPMAWRFAARFGLMDLPNPRKIHARAIPRVGGWGIFLGTLIPVLFVAPTTSLILGYALGAIVLVAFGIWDDFCDIPPRTKIIGQLLAAGLLIFPGGLWIKKLPFMGLEPLPGVFGILVTLFAVTGLINAINTSDGLDGLAGGESLLSLIVIGLLAHAAGGEDAIIVAAATIGGLLGFLRYNTHPAWVFMGDAGSQFIGYTLAFLAILLTQNVNPALSAASTLLFLGLPIADLFAALWHRIADGRRWFQADKNHIHHRLLNLGFRHREAVVMIYGVQTLLVGSALLFPYEYDSVVIGIYLSVCAVLFIALATAERAGWNFRASPNVGALVANEISRPRPSLHTATFTFVKLAVPAYLLAAAYWAADIARDFALISGGVCAALILGLIFGRPRHNIIVRVSVYVATVFSVYFLRTDAPGLSADTIDIIWSVYFVLLVAAIALAVRYTRNPHVEPGAFAATVHFYTTPMDYLLVLAIIAFYAFGNRYAQLLNFSPVVLEALILLYGVEMLLDAMGRRLELVTLSAAATLSVFAFKGLAG